MSKKNKNHNFFFFLHWTNWVPGYTASVNHNFKKVWPKMLNKPVECIEFIECDDEWQLNRECAEWKSYSVSLEEPFAAPPL